MPRSNAERDDELTPSMLTCFKRLFCPLTMLTALRETLKAFASTWVNSLLAAPSTGGDETRTRSEPLCSPATSLRDERGTTCTLNTRRPSRIECSINTKSQLKKYEMVPHAKACRQLQPERPRQSQEQQSGIRRTVQASAPLFATVRVMARSHQTESA